MNGPATPEGITYRYTIEATIGQSPVMIGQAANKYTPSKWEQEITEATALAIYKDELKDRARAKRWQVETGGTSFQDIHIRTDLDSQPRIANMVQTFTLDPSLTHVDFEATPNQWVFLAKADALSLGMIVSKHIQKCFTWCKDTHVTVDALLTLEECKAMEQTIAQWDGVDDNTPQPEPAPEGELEQGGLVG